MPRSIKQICRQTSVHDISNVLGCEYINKHLNQTKNLQRLCVKFARIEMILFVFNT